MDSPPGTAPDGTVVKLMSITRQEFETSLGRLYGIPAPQVIPGRYAITDGAADFPPLFAEFKELPTAVLGGLMALPRAQVTLQMQALSDEERAAFLRRFDKTFQRGGG